jgi:hypothetical protein
LYGSKISQNKDRAYIYSKEFCIKKQFISMLG